MSIHLFTLKKKDRNHMKQTEVLKNYAKAVAIGAYDQHSSGLFGKHDNVRRHWEDRFTRNVIGQFITPLVTSKKTANTGLRIVDLGCGAGEGLNILTSLPQTPATLDTKIDKVLNHQDIACYTGLDLSLAMVEKAKSLHHHHSQAEFAVADLNEGLQAIEDKPAYDIYFSSYGSPSHLKDSALEKLLDNIFEHMGEKAIFVGDFLGRYSYEWPCYWKGSIDTENDDVRKMYSMSYIYDPSARNNNEAESFPIRFWGGEELDIVIQQIAERRGVQVQRKRLCDRSILVGRHMDTREYNPEAPPIRAAINSLHETNCRTDLSQLIFTFKPYEGGEHLNQFFNTLQDSWNTIVYACINALDGWCDPQKLLAEPEAGSPPFVQQAIRAIRHTIQQAPQFHVDDPLANLVEPQLAFLLRDLEWNFQQGLGASHGLLAMYEFHKE